MNIAKGGAAMSDHTPEPWIAKRENWRGEPDPHNIYIAGNVHEDWGDDDEDEEPRDEPVIVATAICIVQGNATSHGVTEANARLILAAPALLAACEEAVGEFVGADWYGDVVEILRAAIAKATTAEV